MVYKLYNVLRSASAIMGIFLLVNTIETSATEYVFTAPPEVKEETAEIPMSDEEYPLYECVSEADDALDSHDCVCADCELELEQEPTEESESEAKDDDGEL